MNLSLRSITMLLALSILASCGGEAESQTMRERMRERAAERAEDGRPGLMRRLRPGAGAGAGAGAAGAAAALPAGTRTVQLSVGGQSRTFHVIAPDGLPSGAPAVMAFHGGGGGRGGGDGSGAARFVDSNPLRRYAASEGFVAVYPVASGGNWNDGRASFAGGPDDVAFVRAVTDWLVANQGVDRSRVFATGISNGGVFAHRLACDAPDLVAGIAPVAASMSTDLLAACAPSSGTPVAMFMGTADPLMVYEGGRSELASRFGAGENGFEIAPAQDVAAFWAARNGCPAAPEATRLPDSASDGTTVTLLDYCPRVELYRIDGGGHTWPGSDGRAPRLAGPVSRDIDATAEMLGFFGRFGL